VILYLVAASFEGATGVFISAMLLEDEYFAWFARGNH